MVTKRPREPPRKEQEMKHKMPKRPTREQKEMIQKAGYVPENWLVVGKDNISLTIMNKESKKKRVILC